MWQGHKVCVGRNAPLSEQPSGHSKCYMKHAHDVAKIQEVRQCDSATTTPRTDPCGLWALGLDAGRKGMSI